MNSEKLSPRQWAIEAVRQCLYWLHRAGCLDAEQLSILLYVPHCKLRSGMLRMAQRLTARMKKMDLLIHERRQDGTHVHALSTKGAKQVMVEFDLEAVSRGRNILKNFNSHRFWSNWAVITEKVMTGLEDDCLFTETEIQSERAPFRMIAGKVPDFLFRRLSTSGEWLYWWGEVENSRRGGRDMDLLVHWILREMRVMEGKPLLCSSTKTYGYLERIRFVITSAAAASFPSRLERALEQALVKSPECNPKNKSVRLMALERLEFHFLDRDKDGMVRLQQQHDGFPVGLTVAEIEADSAREPTQQKITPATLRAATLRAAARMCAEVSVEKVIGAGMNLYSEEWQYCVLVLRLHERLNEICKQDHYLIRDWMLARFHNLDMPLNHMENPVAIEQMLRWLDQDYE